MACEEAGGFVVLTIPEVGRARVEALKDDNLALAHSLMCERNDYARYRAAAEDEFRRLRALSLVEHAGLSAALAQRDKQLARVRWAVRLDEWWLGLLALVALCWEWLTRVRWHRFDRGNVSPLVRVGLCVAFFAWTVLRFGR